MLRIGLIGCGKIADSHAAQIARIEGCRITAACDSEELMARQFGERFSVTEIYSDVSEMLRQAKLDVVHITTPPQSHFLLAQECLSSRCHVYVEKPFTLKATEAKVLLDSAAAASRQITVGHDDQYSHAARRMREIVTSGFIGDCPIHMESTYCYDLSEPGYAKALLADTNHWVRRLPGGLLQNVISHGVARIAEWFTTSQPKVIAHGFTSPILRSLGETRLIDELRVIVSEQDRLTAYFTFSSQMRPCLHQLRLYGRRNGVLLDEDQQTVILLHGKRLKSYAEKFVPPVLFAGQYLRNVIGNAGLFLGRDFHMKSGMKFLMEQFYQSIRNGTSPPIRYEEILRTAVIMDSIFEQLGNQNG